MSPLSSDDKSLLLKLARQSLVAAVCGAKLEAPSEVPASLANPGSAFVSLHENDVLRGCVGFVVPVKPLYETVMEAAAAAALSDTRFLPVAPPELAAIEVEISVLSAFREAQPEEIEVGVHGLMLSRGNARGLLLPQVAVERHWTALQFLEETCKKAGLRPGAWRRGAQLELFTAEIFSERDVR